MRPTDDLSPPLRVGITGASGLIGRHVVSHFLDHAPNVSLRCLARKIPPHTADDRLVWLPGDLISKVETGEFVDGLDVVIHLAQAGGPARSDRDWAGDHAANGQITLNLLQALRDRDGPPAHFVYASSGGSVYGPWRNQPFRESDDCLPLSPYGIQKLAAEHYLRLAVEQGWLTARVLRIGNAYGAILPPEQLQGVIGVSVKRVHQGLPVRLLGSAETVRDYVHLDDLAFAFALAAGTQINTGASPAWSVLNVGSGEGVSTQHIFDLIGEISGRPVAVEQADYGMQAFALTPHVVLNVAKAGCELAWRPAVPLRDGIARLWANETSPPSP